MRTIQPNILEIKGAKLSSVYVLHKREIKQFHVVVVQRRQRNGQKSVMHVQSCCFAYLNYFFLFFFFAVLVVATVVVAPAPSYYYCQRVRQAKTRG